MKDLRQFVDDRLTAMHARPGMWAGSKEAFALQVVLLVEIVSENFECRRLLAKFFPGTNRVSSDPLDDAWARGIVEIARAALSVPNGNVVRIDNASLRGHVVRAALYHEMKALLATTASMPNGEEHRYFERLFWTAASIWTAMISGGDDNRRNRDDE